MISDLIQLALPSLFFALLMASGALVFSVKLGTLTRGAIVPLLLIPLVADWLRFLGNLPFLPCFLAACLIYGMGVSIFYFKRRPQLQHKFVLPSKVCWQVLLGIFLLNILMRTWLFTGTVPNPADDCWGGYKSVALYHATGWTLPAPDADSITFNYYYFLYTWVAFCAGIFGVNFWVGSWLVDVLFCALGAILAFEILKPRINSIFSVLTTIIFFVGGATFHGLVAIAYRLPPKEWGGALMRGLPVDLEALFPRTDNYFWMPFAVFCTGVLLTALHLLLQQWRHRITPIRFAFVVLAISALPGYSTIHLIGFVVIVVPLLLVIVAFKLPTHKRLATLWSFVLLGGLSLLSGLPLITELLKRHQRPSSEGIYSTAFWFESHPGDYSTIMVIKIALIVILSCILYNPLAISSFFCQTSKRRPLYIWLCRGIFLWGTLVCLTGILDKYKLNHEFCFKFGPFIAATGAFLFFQLNSNNVWLKRMFCLALITPLLIIANTVRANIQCKKSDPVWRVIDAKSDRGKIPVYYLVTDDFRNEETPWVKFAPFFSKAYFHLPYGQVDRHSFVYWRDIEFPPQTESDLQRLKKRFPQATQYFLLTTPQANKDGVLYESENFQLSLHLMP